jgi:hypothetical protein
MNSNQVITSVFDLLLDSVGSLLLDFSTVIIGLLTISIVMFGFGKIVGVLKDYHDSVREKDTILRSLENTGLGYKGSWSADDWVEFDKSVEKEKKADAVRRKYSKYL